MEAPSLPKPQTETDLIDFTRFGVAILRDPEANGPLAHLPRASQIPGPFDRKSSDTCAPNHHANASMVPIQKFSESRCCRCCDRSRLSARKGYNAVSASNRRCPRQYRLAD